MNIVKNHKNIQRTIMERLQTIQSHLEANKTAGKSTLTLIDNRTGFKFFLILFKITIIKLGKQIELPIKNNYIVANELTKFTDEQSNPLRLYDPGYMNTIACVINKKNIFFNCIYRHQKFLLLMEIKGY